MSFDDIRQLVRLALIIVVATLMGAEIASFFPRIKIRVGAIIGGLAGLIASLLFSISDL
ncbi:MAG: hypothetical protein LBV19_06520 [Streptococcaceae bacterium]|jgi:hypothetical protein|nr:hypothetical protein [Streptococcaceae bacterium]